MYSNQSCYAVRAVWQSRVIHNTCIWCSIDMVFFSSVKGNRVHLQYTLIRRFHTLNTVCCRWFLLPVTPLIGFLSMLHQMCMFWMINTCETFELKWSDWNRLGKYQKVMTILNKMLCQVSKQFNMNNMKLYLLLSKKVCTIIIFSARWYAVLQALKALLTHTPKCPPNPRFGCWGANRIQYFWLKWAF